MQLKPFSKMTSRERAESMVKVARGKGEIVEIPYLTYVAAQVEVTPASYETAVAEGDEPKLISEAVYEEELTGKDEIERIYVGEQPLGVLADLIGDIVALFVDGLNLKTLTNDPTNVSLLAVLNGENASYLVARLTGLDKEWVKENVYLEDAIHIVTAFFKYHNFFSVGEMVTSQMKTANISESQVRKALLGDLKA